MAGFDFYNPKALLATKDRDWEVPLPAGQRPTRAYMNEHAEQVLSSFATDPKGPDASYASPCHRWEGGLQTIVTNPSCSPRGTGLVMTHTHRRFPVTDTETGATAGFILFGGGTARPTHVQVDKDGRIYRSRPCSPAASVARLLRANRVWQPVNEGQGDACSEACECRNGARRCATSVNPRRGGVREVRPPATSRRKTPTS